MMPRIDWSLSLGNIIVFLVPIVIGGWKLYSSIVKRGVVFEEVLKEHTKLLVAHSGRMDRQEDLHRLRMEKQDDALIAIMRDVNRLIGRMEANHAMDISDAAQKAVNKIEQAAIRAAAKVINTAEQVKPIQP